MQASTSSLFGLFTFGFVLATTVSCGPPAKDAETTNTAELKQVGPTKITAFAVSNENLQVDKVGMRDGELGPDGSLDLAFTATIDGAFSTLYVYSVNEKGEPTDALRADTAISQQEIPPELGSVVDNGQMTLGVGVYENGKLLNSVMGGVKVGAGVHQLTLYAPNQSTLQAGSLVRLWIRSKGKLVASPIVKY